MQLKSMFSAELCLRIVLRISEFDCEPPSSMSSEDLLNVVAAM